MRVAAVSVMPSVVVQANQCSGGGGEVANINEPTNCLLLLQTQLQTNALGVGGESKGSEQITTPVVQEKGAIDREDRDEARMEIDALKYRAKTLHADKDCGSPGVPEASSANSSSNVFKLSVGEFHDVLHDFRAPVEQLQSHKCKAFFRIDDLPQSPSVVDTVSQVFRPIAEVRASPDGPPPNERPSLGAEPMLRMLTYEDVAFPKDYKEMHDKDAWCEMLAVRTPQRPVKVITASSPSGEQMLVMPAIWKSASTTLTSMMEEAQSKGLAQNCLGPHAEKEECEAANVLDQCKKHTTFDGHAAESNVRAAMVRDPLDRFMASVYEHGTWSTCNGKVCEDQVAHAREVAIRLANEFPHKWRSCEHPSQSYFLSATDVHGKPYIWDHVFRLEEMQAGIERLGDVSGVKLSMHGENTSGDKQLKQMYFDAVFDDLKTLCSICKVYLQDFECLGYAKPDRCTQEQCSTVDVSLA